MDSRRRRSLFILVLCILLTSVLLPAVFQVRPVYAQTTETATTTTGGNWTDSTTWTCSPALSPCVPNNTPSDAFDVGINGGMVALDGSSSLKTVTVDSLSVGSSPTEFNLVIHNGETLNVTGNVINSADIYVDTNTYGGFPVTSAGSTLNVGGNFTNAGQLSEGVGYAVGTVNVAGTLQNTGSVGMDGGLITVGNAAPGTLTGYYILENGAVLNFRGGGKISQIGAYSALDLTGPSASIESGGVAGNSALAGLAMISATAYLSLDDGAKPTINSNLTVDGALYVGYYASGASGSSLTVNGTLTNGGLVEIGLPGGGTGSAVSVNGTLVNSGVLAISGGNVSDARSTMVVAGTAPSTLTGALYLQGGMGGATLNYQGGGNITQIGGGSHPTGALTLEGPNAFVEVGSQSGNTALTTLSNIESNGSLDLEDGASLTTNAGTDLSNSGEISVGFSGTLSGSALTVGGDLSNSGDIYVGGASSDGSLNVSGSLKQSAGVTIASAGKLTVLDGAYLQTSGITEVNGILAVPVAVIAGGTLQGTGTIEGTVAQAGGNLQPGDGPGTLRITGDYGLLDAMFTEQIAGGAAGTGYGVLDVTGGLAFIIGTDRLSLTDLSGFTPTEGELFDIINAGSIIGTFSNNDIAFAGGAFMVDYDTSGCDSGSACVDLVWNDAPPAASEPSSLLLLGIALIAAFWILRRRGVDLFPERRSGN